MTSTDEYVLILRVPGEAPMAAISTHDQAMASFGEHVRSGRFDPNSGLRVSVMSLTEYQKRGKS